MLYILWAKVREWATFSSGITGAWAEKNRQINWQAAIAQRDFFGNSLRDRIPMLIFLFVIQLIYFPLNKSGDDAARLDMKVLDGVMPLVGEFVVPYAMGFFFMPVMILLACLILPRHLFQQFSVALFLVMLIGYAFWIIFPAYIYKAPFVPQNIFDQWTQDLHLRDKDYGNHNSFPSSHVYYITLSMYFYARRWRRWWLVWGVIAVVNAWSTMFTHQHYFVDVLAGLLLTILVIWLARDVLVPRIQRWERRHGWQPSINHQNG